MLSLMIIVKMSMGVAPMARRMPISVVRSLTVTTMMLLTPMAPEKRVPKPISHTRMLTPWKRLSIIEKMASALTVSTACVSSGWMVWMRLTTASTFFWMSDIL